MGNMRGTRVPEIRIPVSVNKATQLQIAMQPSVPTVCEKSGAMLGDVIGAYSMKVKKWFQVASSTRLLFRDVLRIRRRRCFKG
jgi:hypothetical protein